MIDRLLLAHTFLTRLPFPQPQGEIGPERLARAAVMFPLVGLTVGGIAALVRWGADPLGPGFATIAALAVVPLITGAFHEDGLADTADGLGPYQRGRRLEAMRDSTLGTFGVLALVFSVLARFALLVPLGTRDASLALIAGHVLGRWSTLPLAGLASPARTDGLGAALVQPGTSQVAAGSILAFALAAPALVGIDVMSAPAALGAAVVVIGASGLYWRRAFGGVTGDTYGATNQLTEIATYVAIAAVL